MATKPFTQDDYEILQTEILYQGFFRYQRLHLKHKLYNGEWSKPLDREILDRYCAAAILPYDPILDRVILIEQFRPGALANAQSPWLLEIPAGLICKNEPPVVIAKQEAMEEAGCSILAIEPICEFFVSPGAMTEYINIYCGQVAATGIGGIHGLPQEGENIRVLNLDLSDALDLLNSGKIKTAPAVTALFWLQLNRERLKKLWV
jgi:ADP-ribose pyrophosphatase